METTLTYRPYIKDDVRQILSLWENDSDFGAITEDVFQKWFLRTPYENTVIIVAEKSDNKIIGQMVFMPTRVLVGEREVKAMRVAAPILDKKYRFNDTPAHPIFSMFQAGIEEAKAKGFSLLYTFPARGWLRAIEIFSGSMINWQTATYNTFCIAIKAYGDGPENDYCFNRAKSFTEEYDQLWERAAAGLPVACGIVRKKEWLSYRLSQHCIIEARDPVDQSLKGYLAVKSESGLLLDILGLSKNGLKKIFWGAVGHLAFLQSEQALLPNGKITGMYTALMAFVLEGKDVEFSNYKFDFGCCALDESIREEDIKAAQWHMTPDV